MWNRQELKAKGKAAFKANYWKCVLVAFIFVLVSGGLFARFNAQDASPGKIVCFIIIALLLSIFLLNPIKLGCQHFFKKNSEAPAEQGEMGFAFKNNYGNIVLTLFLEGLFIALWSILFIIPGIVKTYSYRLVPYILSDNPDMKPTDAITKSRELMQGNKWNTFVLDLSFILWAILGVVTLGIVQLLYVQPYICATDAEIYNKLKDNGAVAETAAEI